MAKEITSESEKIILSQEDIDAELRAQEMVLNDDAYIKFDLNKNGEEIALRVIEKKTGKPIYYVSHRYPNFNTARQALEKAEKK